MMLRKFIALSIMLIVLSSVSATEHEVSYTEGSKLTVYGYGSQVTTDINGEEIVSPYLYSYLHAGQKFEITVEEVREDVPFTFWGQTKPTNGALLTLKFSKETISGEVSDSHSTLVILYSLPSFLISRIIYAVPEYDVNKDVDYYDPVFGQPLPVIVNLNQEDNIEDVLYDQYQNYLTYKSDLQWLNIDFTNSSTAFKYSEKLTYSNETVVNGQIYASSYESEFYVQVDKSRGFITELYLKSSTQLKYGNDYRNEDLIFGWTTDSSLEPGRISTSQGLPLQLSWILPMLALPVILKRKK